MINHEALTRVYKQNLEESMIEYLAEQKSLTMEEAMDIYYHSQLADQIEKGSYGIENMDYKYLVHDLIVNEPELFEK